MSSMKTCDDALLHQQIDFFLEHVLWKANLFEPHIYLDKIFDFYVYIFWNILFLIKCTSVESRQQFGRVRRAGCISFTIYALETQLWKICAGLC